MQPGIPNDKQQRPIIIASNRGPVSLNQTDTGEYEIQRGSGGMVTALTGLARLIDATWISMGVRIMFREDIFCRKGDIMSFKWVSIISRKALCRASKRVAAIFST